MAIIWLNSTGPIAYERERRSERFLLLLGWKTCVLPFIKNVKVAYKIVRYLNTCPALAHKGGNILLGNDSTLLQYWLKTTPCQGIVDLNTKQLNSKEFVLNFLKRPIFCIVCLLFKASFFYYFLH